MNLLWLLVGIIGWLPAGYLATRVLNVWNILAMVMGLGGKFDKEDGSFDVLAPWRDLQWERRPENLTLFRIGILGGWLTFLFMLVSEAFGSVLYAAILVLAGLYFVLSRTLFPLALALWSFLLYFAPGKGKVISDRD